ncbi:MAG: branched-chain amino acid ABC transporter permease [Burkholderiaceae bacterium]
MAPAQRATAGQPPQAVFEMVRRTPLAIAAQALMLGLVIVLASLPWWADLGTMSSAVEFLYYLAIAQLWNLLAGYGGLVSIGQQAWLGLGAYVLVAFALHTDYNPYWALPLGGLAALVLAWPASRLLFRLNGAYFAVGSWVIAEVFRLFFANVTSLGGGTGTSITSSLMAIDEWWLDALSVWSALSIAVLSVLGVYLFLRSRHGLALTAVRDSETASGALGVPVQKVKLTVYLASAFGFGVVGVLVYLVKLRVSPDAAFSVEWSALAFLIVIIGGFGTIEGPIIGAIVYFVLRSLLADYGSWYLVSLGVLAIAVMLVERRGIWGAIQARTGIELFPIQRRIRRRDLTDPGK